jgi:hypothetical protein
VHHDDIVEMSLCVVQDKEQGKSLLQTHHHQNRALMM